MKKGIVLLLLLSLFMGCSMLMEESEPVSSFTEGSTLVKGDSLPDENRSVGSRQQVESDREDFVCYERRITETRNMTELSELGVNDDILYPGALIQGSEAATGVLTPVSLPYGIARQPVTLSLGGITTDGNLSFEMETISLSSARDAINAKLGSLGMAHAAARMEFSKEEVYSREQMSLALGVGVEWPAGQSIDTAVDYTTTEEKSRMVVRFRQVYYSVDMDTPQGLSDVFTGGTAEDIDNLIADQNPLYVSRVFYGRQVFFIMESTCSSEELSVAVEAAMQKGVEGMEAEISINSALSTESVLANTSIKALIYGGDSNGAIQTINGYDGLVNFLSQGASFDPNTGSGAMPLYYQMRFLEDNKVGAITSNAEYTIKEYVRVQQRVRVELDQFRCIGSDDGTFDNTSEIEGHIYVTAMNSSSDPAGDRITLFDNNGHPMAMSNGDTRDPGDLSTILTFDSLSVDNSYIELELKFWDDDSWGDDHFGTLNRQIFLRDGWNRTYEYNQSNDGEGIRSYIKITLIP